MGKREAESCEWDIMHFLRLQTTLFYKVAEPSKLIIKNRAQKLEPKKESGSFFFLLQKSNQSPAASLKPREITGQW